MGISSAQRQLDQFMSRYTDDVARQARTHLAGLRRRLPTAVQFVYDNYNALVIGFGQTERPSEAVLSLALYPRYVSLCFLHGAKLPDPDRRLQGNGNQVRHIRLAEPNSLDDPQVDALIKRAWQAAARPESARTSGVLLIQSISAKQRPRMPGTK